MNSAIHRFSRETPIQNNKSDKAPWITNTVKNLIVKKQKAYIRWKESGDDLSKNLYLTARNRLTDQIRTAKKLYYSNKIDGTLANHNSNAVFDCVNEVLGRNKKHNNFPNRLSTPSGEIETPEQICESFNTYFVNVADTIARNIPDPIANHGVSAQEQSMFLSPITEAEVHSLINNLKIKKAPGIDGINAKLLKDTTDIIVPILTKIINKSFATGVCPDALKIARVIPLHKSGSKSNATNYRPISILPTISKIFERAMHNRLYNYLDKYNILYANQYGFRAKHSTVEALAVILEKLRTGVDCKCNAAVRHEKGIRYRRP